MSLLVTDTERMAKMEKAFEVTRAEMPDVIMKAYNMAVEQEDEEGAADLARRIRDGLLAESDKEVVLDRLGLQVPVGKTFTVWLDFLTTLGQALVSDWTNYRQQLRDLPAQEGFPFNITWPEKPGEQNGVKTNVETDEAPTE